VDGEVLVDKDHRRRLGGSVSEIRLTCGNLVQRRFERPIGDDPSEVRGILRAELPTLSVGAAPGPGSKALDPGPQFVIHTIVVPWGVKCHKGILPTEWPPLLRRAQPSDLRQSVSVF
jgi:hypothetical protein